MTMHALRSMPYAQATVIEYNDGSVTLVSYTTPVILVDRDGWLSCTGTYSATTRRHIGRFMQEMGFGSYQLAKKLYLDGMRYNIRTGEVLPLD